ncbi:MAG TPA: hypothetical protein VFL12_02800 [Thermoanaerobaculia bacterium]|nr:hypothetical protein [Thermoanaerobaculia bacterium]
MDRLRCPWVLAALAIGAVAVRPARGTSRPVDLRAPDGFVLKGTYFAAAKPGPGVVLFHQSNRTRKSWEDVAERLAGAGIHALTVDARGYGESAGRHDGSTWDGDIDSAVDFLLAHAGVAGAGIGFGGAGVLGVEYAVEAARRHPAAVKSLVLMSGETDASGLEYLHDATGVPGLFVTADADEYPPTVEAMELLYVTASSPSKKLVHYPARTEAPWLWYEPFDIGKVTATGNHGTDLFAGHPELSGMIVDRFVTTLLRTPGHAPAEILACAATLGEIRSPDGVARVAERLRRIRETDPQAQIFPEIGASIIGQDHLRAGDAKRAVEVLGLVVLAYPDSADAHDNLGAACFAAGDNDRARQHAEKALALLDSHAAPASSWTDTEAYRGEIRKDAEKTLGKLAASR